MPDICEGQLYISEVLSVYKGTSSKGHTHIQSRHSDSFVFVLTGEATYFFGSRKMKAEPGNILFLAGGSMYDIDVPCENFTHIHVNFNFRESEARTFDCNIFKSETLASAESDFINLYKKWQIGSIADKVGSVALVYGIYSKIIASESYSYIDSSQKNYINNAVEIIHRSFGNPEFDVEGLADCLGLSSVHLRRLFKKTHNTSPIKYLTSVRVEKAKELLRYSERSVNEISEICGFASGYYFSRVFKAETGFTPTQYRSIIGDYM